MKVAFYSAKKYDRQFFNTANENHGFSLDYIETPLNRFTAQSAKEYECVCAFVNDQLDEDTLKILAQGKTRLLAMRCAGFNNVDLPTAKSCGITVVRVPAYSPYAVAEHVIALLMALYRTTHRSYNRVREGNFSLDGMVGHEVNGKTVGVIGTGKIGSIVTRLFKGFGCHVVAYDRYPDESLEIEYVSLDELWKQADIVTLHCPLLDETRHMVNADTIEQMKTGVTLINTSRGGLIDTQAVYQALKSRKIGHLGIDVYEEEENLFFEDLSSEIIQDDLFMRLTTFPNVIITGHQAFFTRRALGNIADTTLNNIAEYADTGRCKNAVE